MIIFILLKPVFLRYYLQQNFSKNVLKESLKTVLTARGMKNVITL